MRTVFPPGTTTSFGCPTTQEFLKVKQKMKEFINDTTVQGIQIKRVKQTANIIKLTKPGRT